MDDIPLADVVTAQPRTRPELTDPVLSGAGPLKAAETLVVKQRIRAFEILSLCTLCEVILTIQIFSWPIKRHIFVTVTTMLMSYTPFAFFKLSFTVSYLHFHCIL